MQIVRFFMPSPLPTFIENQLFRRNLRELRDQSGQYERVLFFGQRFFHTYAARCKHYTRVKH